jgi:hypothetical protein
MVSWRFVRSDLVIIGPMISYHPPCSKDPTTDKQSNGRRVRGVR